MAVVVRILIAVAILIAIPLLGALFVRKTFTVEREVTINKSKPEVFHYLKHLKNHESFTKWAALDPNMKKDYRGEDGTVGLLRFGKVKTRKSVRANKKSSKLWKANELSMKFDLQNPSNPRIRRT